MLSKWRIVLLKSSYVFLKARFLIYINDLPGSLEFSSARMFADDTTLTASGESVLDAEVAINHDLANIKQWLSENKLSLNLVKTEYLLIRSRHNINNLFHAPKVHVGDIPIKRAKKQRHLGSVLMNIYLGISTLK